MAGLIEGEGGVSDSGRVALIQPIAVGEEGGGRGEGRVDGEGGVGESPLRCVRRATGLTPGVVGYEEVGGVLCGDGLSGVGQDERLIDIEMEDEGERRGGQGRGDGGRRGSRRGGMGQWKG